MKLSEWATLLIPVLVIAGGFLMKTYELQGRVNTIEIDRRTSGQKALSDLRILEDRVLSIELKCECSQ